MTLITHTQDLKQALKDIEKTDDFVAIDTEFLRETTYWPKLCLVQIAGTQATLLVDALSPSLSLEPLFDFLKNDHILKVFHAGRQDLEIFYHLMGEVPQSIFDTQVAAMVCGYGDQVGYETIVSSLLGKKLNKSQQYSNWMRRPLSEPQILYAKDDVIYLRDVYLYLSGEISEKKRKSWIESELGILKSAETYLSDPEKMWVRFRLKNAQPHYLARLRALAFLREREAMEKNVPRGYILRDDFLGEIASHNPSSLKQLSEIRGAGKSLASQDFAQKVLETLEQANALPSEKCPRIDIRQKGQNPPPGHLELLKVLLKIKSEEYKVAERLVATTKDLENFLLLKERDPENALLSGWRYEIFGREAWDVKEGKKALGVKEKTIALYDV